ncbi:MAG: hypothetical protein AB199_01295 [Parcubacteria bacterium C7867-004]|nr:MAG: hypothetical protein AB199_01295 [Parcubacteria bacterium C7867-004]
MAKSKEKLEAYALRRQGQSVKEIARKLGVASSTVSIWTRDIPLTDVQKKHLLDRQVAAGYRGRILGAETNKTRKAERIRKAADTVSKEISLFSNDALFFTGLGLYWGEGTKTETSSVGVSNTDPRVMRLMVQWFTECLGVKRSRFMPRVFISDTHRDREETITRHWMETLGLPRTQFRKTVFLDKGKKIYENHDMYYGVLALRVSKGVDIRYRILAQISRVAELVNEDCWRSSGS